MIDETKIEISKLPLMEAYQMFKLLVDNSSNYFRKVRFGHSINFDLDSYLNGFINTCIRKKKEKILINSTWHTLVDFNTELNHREKLIKQFLMDNSEKFSITRSNIDMSMGNTMNGIGDNYGFN